MNSINLLAYDPTDYVRNIVVAIAGATLVIVCALISGYVAHKVDLKNPKSRITFAFSTGIIMLCIFVAAGFVLMKSDVSVMIVFQGAIGLALFIIPAI